jgi:WD40 repeat protein
MSQMDAISVKSYEKIDDKPHNGKPITKIEISTNEKYLVTYSENDRSIVGWNVEDVDKDQPKSELKVNDVNVRQMCFSDDKKLAYINNESFLSKLSLLIIQ